MKKEKRMMNAEILKNPGVLDLYYIFNRQSAL